MSIMKHLVVMAEQKGCHGNIPVIRQLVEMPVQETNVRCVECERGTGSDPGYRVSHVSVARKRSDKTDTMRTQASHTSHNI